MSTAIGAGWGLHQAPDTWAVQRDPGEMKGGSAAGKSQNSLLMPQQRKRAELVSSLLHAVGSQKTGNSCICASLPPIDCHLPERILRSAPFL